MTQRGRWFQIHLSTALVVMLEIGTLLFLSFAVRNEARLGPSIITSESAYTFIVEHRRTAGWPFAAYEEVRSREVAPVLPIFVLSEGDPPEISNWLLPPLVINILFGAALVLGSAAYLEFVIHHESNHAARWMTEMAQAQRAEM